MISQVYKFTSISFLPFRRKGYLISREPVLPRVSGDKSFWGFNPRTTSWPCVLHVVPRGCIGATRIARVVELCVCVCGKSAGSQEEFIQPLRAAKLCAPGMVVVCRNAAVLSHHRAPLRAHSLPPLFSFSVFFFFFFILNPRSRFGDNQSEGDRGLE